MRNLLAIILLIFIPLISMGQDLPYKNSDEFEVYTSFQLIKERPEERPDYSTKRIKRYDGTPQMHLDLVLTITKVNENEASLKVITQDGLLKVKRKMKVGVEVPLQFGNFEQVKMREIPHLFTIFIQDKQKNNISKIFIEVLENGAIFVNEKPLGKN